MKIKVNTRLLPIKASFFFFWGGLSGVMPYLPVIAQSLGISASAMALIAAFFPFVSLVAKPFFGSLADRSQKLKLIIVIFLPLTAVSYFGIVFLKPIKFPLLQNFLLCSSRGSEFGLPSHYASDCIASIEKQNITSSLSSICAACAVINQTVLSDFSNISTDQLDCESKKEHPYLLTVSGEAITRAKANIWFPVLNQTIDENSLCEPPRIFQCETIFPQNIPCHNHESEKSIFVTSQFWLFLLLFVLSRTGSSVLISLSDTVCFNLLDGQYHKYGQQRLWGAVGWGTFSLISTYVSSFYHLNDHSLGFYSMIVAFFLNIVVLLFADVRYTHSQGKIVKNVAFVLKNVQVLIFLLGVLVMGILTGFMWTYLFWFLKNLGASDVQFALVLVVECFLGELPFFFIAGWVISKIGNRNALSITLGAFGVRFLAYSYLTDPWYVLPIELTQGITFGLFYTLMTTYAKAVTPPGTEATIQGLVGGTFEGLGFAIGSLAGFGIDHLGDRAMFRIFSYFAFVACVLHICAHLVFKLLKVQSTETRVPVSEAKREEETSFLPNSKNVASIAPNTS